MTRVFLRPEAEADLIEIALYIAESDVVRAQKLVTRLRKRLSTLTALPLAGRLRPEFAEGMRSLVERPYVILYRLVGEDAEIVAFLHGARDLPAALANRIAREGD